MIVRPAKDRSFVFDVVPPGDYRVHTAPRFPQAIGLDKAFGGEIHVRRPSLHQSVRIVAGQTTEVVFSPDRGDGRVIGRVSIDAAPPPPGFHIGIQQDRRHGARYHRLQPDGAFEITGIAARPSMLTLRRKGEAVFYSQSIEIKSGAVTRLTVDLVTGGLRGAVLLPSGDPAANVRVKLDGSVGPGSSGRHSAQCDTDTDGRFRFDGLPAGLYVVNASHGALAATAVAQRITGGEVKNCEPIALARIMQVFGRVESGDDGAKPIRIALERDGFSTEFEPVAPSGLFGIERVPPGTYRARVMVRSGIRMSTRLLPDVIEVREDRRGLVLQMGR